MKNLIVMKFGGTSVGSAAAIQQVVEIVQNQKEDGNQLVVVVSAAAGVTNALDLGVQQALGRSTGQWNHTLVDIQKHIQTIVTELLQSKACAIAFTRILASFIQEARQIYASITEDLSELPAMKDQALSIGERIQSYLVAAAFQEAGLLSTPISATELILTNDVHQEAEPLQPESEQLLNQRILPLLQAGMIPVITGFIGATPQGKITTLGRSGSDYSAAILAAGLSADELWIWTDVDGILSTDPTLVQDARLITNISYPEAFRLAQLGARVLHPKTILPLAGKEIPIYIKNTFNHENQGTTIHTFKLSTKTQIKAVTGVKKVNIIAVRKRCYENFSSLIAFSERALAALRVPILGIFQDKERDCAYIALKRPLTQAQMDAFEEQLGNLLPGLSFSRLSVRPAQTLVAAIGLDIQKNPILPNKLKYILAQAGIEVSGGAFHSTDHSLSFLVAATDHEKAIQQLHREVITHA